MARSKSTSGGKINRTTTNPAQSGTNNPANIPDVKAVDEETVPVKTAPEVKITPEPRRLEVVKSEPRKNVVVPIKLEDEIRRRAYELYVQRGNASGSEAEDWLTAEREVRQRYQKQQSA